MAIRRSPEEAGRLGDAIYELDTSARPRTRLGVHPRTRSSPGSRSNTSACAKHPAPVVGIAAMVYTRGAERGVRR